MVSIKNLKQEKLIRKSRDCYKPLGVLKNSFKRVREFYIELKLGSVGFLREGKTGEKPLQQRKNQRRNLDFGFQSLAGFRIPQKNFKEFRFQKEKFPESRIRITFHWAKCSFPEQGPGAPLFLDRGEAQRALKKFLETGHPPRPPPISSLSQGVDDRAPPYLQVWIRLW